MKMDQVLRRCYWCKKFIYPWQKGSIIGTVHVGCDEIKFRESIHALSSIFGIEWSKIQMENRKNIVTKLKV